MPNAGGFQAWADAVGATAQDPGDPYSVVDACVAAEMRQANAPGASIAIAVDGNVAYAKGYGVRHRENGGQVDAQTMFRIGSTTKMMTAAALMTLVDDGALDLHAPITDYLPDLRFPEPGNAADVTVHQLLTHTSGLPDSYLMPTFALFDAVPLTTWAEHHLPRTPPAAPPGTFWNYSNPNFSLAGHLLERVTGTAHAGYIEQHVWEPSGMPLTTLDPEDVRAHGNFAWGHTGGDRVSPDRVMPALSPAGMAYSTPTEMVTWALTLMNGGGATLSPASAAAMQTPHVATDATPWERYGYGIFVTDYLDRRDPARIVAVFEHGGNSAGWASRLFWVPERGVAVSILDNSPTSLASSARCVLRELAGIVPRPTGGLTTDPTSWDAFTGTYAEMNQALWDATVRITREGRDLRLHHLEADTVDPLLNTFGSSFVIDADRDGRPDPGTAGRVYTFSGDKTDGGRTRWLRNRVQVSERVGRFPASIDILGASCAPLTFTPEIEIPKLDVLPAGLVPTGPTVSEGRVRQDDPADPSTASFKLDVSVAGGASLFTARLVPQAGDMLGLYLLGDLDGDADFTYPDELVDVGWEGQGYRLLNANVHLPAGRYQLWVHGESVRGASRAFTLATRMVHGENLSVANAPAAVLADTPYTVDICARGVAGFARPMTGLVAFHYGRPPRRVRIPVRWSPVASTAVYLPATLRGAEGWPSALGSTPSDE